MSYKNLFEKYKKELFEAIEKKCNNENLIESSPGRQKYLIENEGKKIYVSIRKINWFYQMIIAQTEELSGSTNHLVLINHSSGEFILGYVKRAIGGTQKPEVVLRADSTREESKDFFKRLSSKKDERISIVDNLDPFGEMAKANEHASFLAFYNSVRHILGLEEITATNINNHVSQKSGKSKLSGKPKVSKELHEIIDYQEKTISRQEGIIASLLKLLKGQREQKGRNTDYNKRDKI